METRKRTPQELFNLPQHFVVPLFQRRYVWKEDEQWEPLWGDVRRVAELRLHEPHLNAQHFLGAVVFQAHDAGINSLPTWNVIDGQQRLTTLQLLMDAAAGVLAEAVLMRFSNQLKGLTHNSEDYVPDSESRLKVRHLNSDRDAFDEVMTAESPLDYSSLKHSDSLIVQAHQYFTTAVTQWLGDSEADDFSAKAEQLAHVLREDLQLVTIELEARENSQEIFETLNARGTPLTAADLVRNFVFQRLEAEGADTKKAYKEDWPFETKFWAKEVSFGRYPVSRSSLFLNQWLVSRTGEEIRPQSTFTQFKSYVEHRAGQKMVDLLPAIKEQARLYEAWTEAASKPGGGLSRTELAVYRMQANRVELLKPLLLWLHEPRRNLPDAVTNSVIDAAESWVVRRQMLRLAGADLGRIVADLIKVHSGAPEAELPDRVRAYLARLNVTSTYWPGDDEIRSALAIEPVFRRYPRARLRSYLEAIEDAYRAETSQPQVERVGFPIEHILPQKWQDNWPVVGKEAEEDRQARVHRLGNLTLLTSSLNSKVSNGTWATKRRGLLEHNTIKLTGRLIERTEGREWDESLIDQRTDDLIGVLLAVWAVPVGHRGEVIDPHAKVQDWVEPRHLIEAGLIAPGAKLTANHRDHVGVEARVVSGGLIEYNGRRYDTPSGAAKAVSGKAANGWYFWSLNDGRRLRDVRTEFMAQAENAD